MCVGGGSRRGGLFGCEVAGFIGVLEGVEGLGYGLEWSTGLHKGLGFGLSGHRELSFGLGFRVLAFIGLIRLL